MLRTPQDNVLSTDWACRLGYFLPWIPLCPNFVPKSSQFLSKEQLLYHIKMHEPSTRTCGRSSDSAEHRRASKANDWTCCWVNGEKVNNTVSSFTRTHRCTWLAAKQTCASEWSQGSPSLRARKDLGPCGASWVVTASHVKCNMDRPWLAFGVMLKLMNPSTMWTEALWLTLFLWFLPLRLPNVLSANACVAPCSSRS